MILARNTTPRKFSGLTGLGNFRGVLHEECGILVSRGSRVRIVPVPNAVQGSSEYGITLRDYQAVKKSLRRSEKIVGFFHTHLQHHPAEPSEADLESASENTGLYHVVYKPSTGEVTWYMG